MLTVLLVVLATHRLTVLVVSDRILATPRDRLQARFERRAEARTATVSRDEWQSPFAYLLSCEWCASIWIGGLVTGLTALTVGVALPVLTWLAASGVTGVLAELTDD
jgi:hypothetical protein